MPMNDNIYWFKKIDNIILIIKIKFFIVIRSIRVSRLIFSFASSMEIILLFWDEEHFKKRSPFGKNKEICVFVIKIKIASMKIIIGHIISWMGIQNLTLTPKPLIIFTLLKWVFVAKPSKKCVILEFGKTSGLPFEVILTPWILSWLGTNWGLFSLIWGEFDNMVGWGEMFKKIESRWTTLCGWSVVKRAGI